MIKKKLPEYFKIYVINGKYCIMPIDKNKIIPFSYKGTKFFLMAYGGSISGIMYFDLIEKSIGAFIGKVSFDCEFYDLSTSEGKKILINTAKRLYLKEYTKKTIKKEIEQYKRKFDKLPYNGILKQKGEVK